MIKMRTKIRFLPCKRLKVERMVKGLRLMVLFVLSLSMMESKAQVFQETTEAQNHGATENIIVADGFWKNWYVQFGLDMTLQNPYGYDFSKVFPNGKSFGVNLGFGKWLIPEFGIRAGLNW